MSCTVTRVSTLSLMCGVRPALEFSSARRKKLQGWTSREESAGIVDGGNMGFIKLLAPHLGSQVPQHIVGSVLHRCYSLHKFVHVVILKRHASPET